MDRHNQLYKENMSVLSPRQRNRLNRDQQNANRAEQRKALYFSARNISLSPSPKVSRRISATFTEGPKANEIRNDVTNKENNPGVSTQIRNEFVKKLEITLPTQNGLKEPIHIAKIARLTGKDSQKLSHQELYIKRFLEWREIKKREAGEKQKHRRRVDESMEVTHRPQGLPNVTRSFAPECHEFKPPDGIKDPRADETKPQKDLKRKSMFSVVPTPPRVKANSLTKPTTVSQTSGAILRKALSSIANVKSAGTKPTIENRTKATKNVAVVKSSSISAKPFQKPAALGHIPAKTKTVQNEKAGSKTTPLSKTVTNHSQSLKKVPLMPQVDTVPKSTAGKAGHKAIAKVHPKPSTETTHSRSPKKVPLKSQVVTVPKPTTGSAGPKSFAKVPPKAPTVTTRSQSARDVPLKAQIITASKPMTGNAGPKAIANVQLKPPTITIEKPPMNLKSSRCQSSTRAVGGAVSKLQKLQKNSGVTMGKGAIEKNNVKRTVNFKAKTVASKNLSVKLNLKKSFLEIEKNVEAMAETPTEFLGIDEFEPALTSTRQKSTGEDGAVASFDLNRSEVFVGETVGRNSSSAKRNLFQRRKENQEKKFNFYVSNDDTLDLTCEMSHKEPSSPDNTVVAKTLIKAENSNNKTLTPESANVDRPANYLSPFVSVSRGKVNARQEKEKRNSFYLASSSSNDDEGKSVEETKSQTPAEKRMVLEAVRYFRKRLDDEIQRLHELCDEWETYKESNMATLQKTGGVDMIDATIGQTKLLTSKKFMQFKGLIDRCEAGARGTGASDDGSEDTKPINTVDLEGFWSMLGLQIENVDKRFVNLDRWKDNDWIDPDADVSLPKQNLKRVKKGTQARGITAKAKPSADLKEFKRKMQADMRMRKKAANDGGAPDATNKSPGNELLKAVLKSNAKRRSTIANVPSTPKSSPQRLVRRKSILKTPGTPSQTKNVKFRFVREESSDDENEDEIEKLILFGSHMKNKMNTTKKTNTPESANVDRPANYLSPFVSVSRGKVNSRQEKEKRNSFYLASGSSNDDEGKSLEETKSQTPAEKRMVLEAVRYFRKQLDDEIQRLHELCDEWETYKESNMATLQKTGGVDMIDATIGQTKLLTSKKFMQFKGLIDRCEAGARGTGASDDGSEDTKPINTVDLEGFWSMLGLQIENVDKRFVNLDRWKDNDWMDPDADVSLPKQNLKRVKKGTQARGITAKAKPSADLKEFKRKMQADMRKKAANVGGAPVVTNKSPGNELLKAVLKSNAKRRSSIANGPTPPNRSVQSSARRISISKTPDTPSTFKNVNSCGDGPENDGNPIENEDKTIEENDSETRTYALRNRKIRLRPSCEIIIPQ